MRNCWLVWKCVIGFYYAKFKANLSNNGIDRSGIYKCQIHNDRLPGLNIF